MRQQLKPICILPITSLENLGCHRNQSTAIKNNVIVEAINAMNSTAKVQLYHPYDLWGVDFLNIFRKISISIAMTTNEIVGFR